MISKNISALKIHKLTQAQYEDCLKAETLEEDAIYLTPEQVTYTAEEVDKLIATKVSEINALVDKTSEKFLSDAKIYTDDTIYGKLLELLGDEITATDIQTIISEGGK